MSGMGVWYDLNKAQQMLEETRRDLVLDGREDTETVTLLSEAIATVSLARRLCEAP